MEGNLDGFLPWTLFPFKESRNPGARETRGLLDRIFNRYSKSSFSKSKLHPPSLPGVALAKTGGGTRPEGIGVRHGEPAESMTSPIRQAQGDVRWKGTGQGSLAPSAKNFQRNNTRPEAKKLFTPHPFLLLPKPPYTSSSVQEGVLSRHRRGGKHRSFQTSQDAPIAPHRPASCPPQCTFSSPLENAQTQAGRFLWVVALKKTYGHSPSKRNQ